MILFPYLGGNIMKLNIEDLKKADSWNKANIKIPLFNYENIQKMTLQDPRWIHFGAGNLFRVHVARAYQELLDRQEADRGILSVVPRNFELIDSLYTPYDHLTLAVLMKSDGSFENTVVASIMDTLSTSIERGDRKRLMDYFENPKLQMISFTITEKGYALKQADGRLLSQVQKDIKAGPEKAEHLMSVITSLLYRRYSMGAAPLALVSMDNCSNNGDILKASVLAIARGWADNEQIDSNFIDYLEDNKKISFPISMIDKITPGPSDSVLELLKIKGLENLEIMQKGHTRRAPFVNAEECEYLVIEDHFPNGRPALEKAGFLMTDREHVNKVETMKLTTCLNPLHTALAVYGCLLGYSSIWQEMEDPHLKKLVELIGYTEGLPVVEDPEIINPREFLDQVIEQRLCNPNIPDAPQRIACDSSQKVGIRFGHTLQAYMDHPGKSPDSLIGIPLAIAGWLRYLTGLNDQGESFELSSDPMLDFLTPLMEPFQFGIIEADLKPILGNKQIFPMELYESGIGQKIEKLFIEMMQGPGAVRKVLQSYLV